MAKMRPLMPDCYTPYSMWSEAKDSYGVGWKPFVGDEQKNNSGDEWRYRLIIHWLIADLLDN